jgi:hypothetical protein
MPVIERRVPGKARSRPALKTGRLLNCQLGGDINESTSTVTRAQVLNRLGIPAHRAGMFGAFIYGEEG